MSVQAVVFTSSGVPANEASGHGVRPQQQLGERAVGEVLGYESSTNEQRKQHEHRRHIALGVLRDPHSERTPFTKRAAPRGVRYVMGRSRRADP